MKNILNVNPVPLLVMGYQDIISLNFRILSGEGDVESFQVVFGQEEEQGYKLGIVFNDDREILELHLFAKNPAELVKKYKAMKIAELLSSESLLVAHLPNGTILSKQGIKQLKQSLRYDNLECYSLSKMSDADKLQSFLAYYGLFEPEVDKKVFYLIQGKKRFVSKDVSNDFPLEAPIPSLKEIAENL